MKAFRIIAIYFGIAYVLQALLVIGCEIYFGESPRHTADWLAILLFLIPNPPFVFALYTTGFLHFFSKLKEPEFLLTFWLPLFIYLLLFLAVATSIIRRNKVVAAHWLGRFCLLSVFLEMLFWGFLE